MLVKQGHDVQLALVGRGSTTAFLKSLADSLGIAAKVFFLGYLPGEHLRLIYRAADIFCMPSPVENQSIATLEAMASGRPVLAANARALPELVTTGENGFLFEPDNPASVAEGIAFLIGRRSQWAQMGKASRLKAEQHGLDGTLSKYEELYRRLIDQKAASIHSFKVRTEQPGSG